MHWWYGGMGPAGWLLMALFWLALLGAIVWAVARIFPARPDRSERPRERPEEILDRRLASGEIDSTTYDELRAKLRSARKEAGR